MEPIAEHRRARALGILGVVATAVAVVALASSGDARSDPSTSTSTLDLTGVRTVVSAPNERVTPASAGGAQPAPAPTTTLDVGAVLAGSVTIPDTGGYTDMIKRHFGDAALEALVIVQCESGFLATAVNVNTDGTRDHGLFQINDVHTAAFGPVTGRSWEDRYDPEANTTFARWLYGRAGWKPWRCGISLDPDRADG